MKRIIPALSALLLLTNSLLAQLPNGTTAPNWTMTDVNNVSHTLYNYLNDNKIVFLDFSATWCGPCWNYHQSNAFQNVHYFHGPPANGPVMAFMIETDAGTNTNCLYDLPGCVGGTQGDWVTGKFFPIIDNASQYGPYNINYYPTVYGICPDKKIYQVGQANQNELWEFAQGCSAPFLTVQNAVNVNCYGGSNGAITVGLTGGMAPFTFLWSNGATTQSLTNLSAGAYSLTVTGSLGATSTIGTISIEQPSAPLATSSVDVTPEGCAGLGGSISISINGGTPPYGYLWSNGGNSSFINNLSAGSYSVVVTDANGCTISQNNIVVEPPAIPNAAAAAPTMLTCTNQSVNLSGSGSSTGPSFIYNWTTTDGHIVAGANTLNNCFVNEVGSYHLLVQNTANNCVATAFTTVTANQTAPMVTAGPPGTITCTNSQTTLNGVGPTGQGFNVLWTTVGGNIVSGATTLNPVVNAGGSYTLTITNTTNGCSGASTTTVTSNIAAPNASANGGTITCASSNVNLVGNSTTPGVGYAWTGPNGFSSNQQNPTVGAPGSYLLTVTNPANGCTATATAQVTLNTTTPQATAQGGTITCLSANVTLGGSSTTPNVSYGWTGPNNFSSNQQQPTVSATGNYVLTVTGSNGCTSMATGIVTQNTTPPTANAGPSGVLNCSANEAVLNGTASSAGSQFSYLWTTTNGHIVSGATTLTPTADEAGSYVLTVTNNTNGCTSTASTPVVQRQPVAANIAAQMNVSCNGNATGSATATGGGGNGSYTYAWSNGGNTATVSGLSAGNYSVVVTDGENCAATKTVNITEPTALTVNATTTAQSAPGVNDGLATANPQGGTGSYAFLWSNGGTTQTIADLAPGNYTVSVTDANGCLKVQAVTVNVFGCAVSANMASEDASCHGSNDGSASITLTNAAMPQVFLWSNGAETQDIGDLAPGTYTVSATDGNGCEVVASVSIGQPNLLNANTTATGLTASGQPDGTASANPTGGTGPFSFVWSNGAITQAITGLPSANYTVSVTDANGCTAVQTVPVAPFGCSTVANVSASHISCFGAADGQATVTLTGGLTPYTFLWSNGKTTATITGLEAGSYSVSVNDAVNCPAIIGVTILEPAVLELALSEFSNTDCGADIGYATVAASGGTTSIGYHFVWSNGESGPTLSNLGAGSYGVSVTDGNDCEATINVQVGINDSEPPMALTQNLTLALNGSGTASLSASQVDNGSTDNCTIESMTIDKTDFDCNDLGLHEVTLTIVDVAGNTSTGTATIEVVDNQSPVISVQNVVVFLDENGTATIAPQMLDGGSSDNCSIAEQTIDVASFTCANFGLNAVVLTVVDASGNSAAGTSIVNVQDNTAPVLTCPGDMVLAYCDPVASFAIEASDNCAQGLLPSQIAGLPSGANFPAGTTVQAFEVSDGHGNAGTCSFTITVPQPMQVDLTVVDVACFGGMDGSISASVSGSGQGYTYLWSNGANTPEIANLGTGIFTVSVTDDAGCMAVQSAIITEPAALMVMLGQATPATIGQQNGAIEVVIEGGATPYSYLWQDGSGNVISNQQNLINIAAGNYILEVTDANGCTVQQEFTVQPVSSITQRKLEQDISLFPNPTTGILTMAFDDMEARYASISVLDLTGRLVVKHANADVSSGMYVLDVSGIADGVYFVRIMIDSHIVAKRLVVQK